MIDLKSLLQSQRARVGAAAAGIAVIGALFALQGTSESAVAEAKIAPQVLLLVPADVITASTGNVAGGIKVTGTLEPLNRTSVNARVGGVLLDVPVREGERVAAGQLLARQDPADLQAQLVQAEAQLSSAQTDLKLVEALEQKKTDLYEKKYLSEVDWAAAKGETDVRRAQVRVQEAAVAIARRALADTEVRAPIAGIVAERFVQPGTRIAPGQSLLTLVDLAELELAAAIPARDVPQVKVGSEVLFTVDGLGNREFRGRIVRVNPMATSGSRTITVYARVANRDGVLRGGMFASGRVAAGNARHNVVRIPAGAVRDIDGRTQVWVVRDGKLALQGVTLGVRDAGSGLVEVKEGLTAGERVILTRIGDRTPGTPVSIADPR
ncbi:MAG: efflux RND transporter periplasmic adaptor subunit [Pseudomonadota bacterium]